MKALVLSVVIALSASFASASCTLADNNVTSRKGAYTREDANNDQRGSNAQAQSVSSNDGNIIR